MAILILDNFDSFTYNLLHYVEQLTDEECRVIRNDAISAEEAAEFSRILISPGPGLPAEAGVTMDIIRRWHRKKPILGVCLGHQALGEFFGAGLINLEHVQHGVASEIRRVAEDVLFTGLPDKWMVGRYHSWVVDPETLSPDMLITAVDKMDNVMAMRHREWNLHGVQFHPESVMTDYGLDMIRNWLHASR